MPNWCSNRMYFSGEPAQIAEIKRLASGAVTPLYRRATNEGIQLFLAGSAGLLQITENIRSEQCPGVTAAGRGAVSTENIAFTRWLTHLQNGVLLDEQNCLMLHELWLQSGTGQRRWEGLPDDVRETITVHFTAKRGDWCDIWGNWMMNGEYGSEFGGFFPVQVRFTPAHERFHLALCSPGDVSQLWMLVLVNCGGQPFAVVQVQHIFTPVAISHTLALAATLDAQGYSVNDIIHILMAEGGQA